MVSLLSLTLAHPDGDLIIPGRPDPVGLGHGAWITKLTLPNRTWRRTEAPPSAYFPGQTPLAFVLDSVAITAIVSIKAATPSELGDQIDHLELVASQFVYELTTVTETRTQVWEAEPADIAYGDYSVSGDRMAATQLVLSIPANPTA